MKNSVRILSMVLMISCVGCPSMTDVMTIGGDGDATTPTVNDTLSVEQQAATKTAVDSIKIVAEAVSSILAVIDIEAFVSGNGQVPTCPTISADLDSDAFQIAFDYGDACLLSRLPGVTLGGQATGTLFFNVDTIELALQQLMTSEFMVDGTLAGGFSQTEDQVTFALNISLTTDTGSTIDGGATIRFNLSQMSVTIVAGSVNATSGGSTVAVSSDDVEFLLTGEGSTLPSSGSIELSYTTEDSTMTTIVVNFKTTTPVDSMVSVSVNNADAEDYTLAVN